MFKCHLETHNPYITLLHWDTSATKPHIEAKPESGRIQTDFKSISWAQEQNIFTYLNKKLLFIQAWNREREGLKYISFNFDDKTITSVWALGGDSICCSHYRILNAEEEER